MDNDFPKFEHDLNDIKWSVQQVKKTDQDVKIDKYKDNANV